MQPTTAAPCRTSGLQRAVDFRPGLWRACLANL